MGDGQADTRAVARPRLTWLLLLVVTVGLYAAGLLAAGVEDVADAVSDASPTALVGALLLQVVVVLVWPLVHRASVRSVGEDLRYGQALNVSMSAFTVSHAVPGGGAVAAGVVVDRLTDSGVPGPAATASAALTGPVALTTIIGLGTGGVTAAVLAGELPGVLLLVAVAGLVVLFGLLGAIVAATRSPALGERVIGWLGRRHARLERRVDGWTASWRRVTRRAPTPRNVLRIFAWSTAKWLADIASLALVFVAFGQTPRVTVLLVGFAVSQALAAVPVTPGGLGVVEGGMAGAFVTLGLPLSVATPIVLTYRLLESWLPTAAGVPVLVRSPSVS